MSSFIRRLLIGRPFETARSHEERLSKTVALPIFASDALSSSAYATEEILFALMLAGTVAFAFSMPIAVAIVVLEQSLVAVLVAAQHRVGAPVPRRATANPRAAHAPRRTSREVRERSRPARA